MYRGISYCLMSAQIREYSFRASSLCPQEVRWMPSAVIVSNPRSAAAVNFFMKHFREHLYISVSQRKVLKQMIAVCDTVSETNDLHGIIPFIYSDVRTGRAVDAGDKNTCLIMVLPIS